MDYQIANPKIVEVEQQYNPNVVYAVAAPINEAPPKY